MIFQGSGYYGRKSKFSEQIPITILSKLKVARLILKMHIMKS